jgi:GH15 family glucan-1,4-alpha-glucosidase
MAQAIEDHGIVGDLRTAALVDLNGTIDFLCWPHFDSPSIFAALLDEKSGGAFELAPVLDGARHRQLYLPDTNILLTRFLSEHGVAAISDFMPLGDAETTPRLVRRVKAIRKAIRFRMKCAPRFDYARARHDTRADGDTILFTGDDGVSLCLRSSVAMRIEDGAAIAEFDLEPGQSAHFILEDGECGEASAAAQPDYVATAFKATSTFWHDWVARSTYHGRWRDAVSRSSLALKLLTSARHGSMIAALTFGLPEEIGGSRNWDYRYAWLRDSAFTVYAFLRLGYTEEAQAFVRWLARIATGGGAKGELKVMYGLDGRTDLDELELGHLAGYRGSVPVRIGNAAHEQRQLDIYGELMDAMYLSDKYAEQITWASWQGITERLEWLSRNWRLPDEGIWEIRGERREFLHSRLMSWVAFDRAIRLARKRGLPCPMVDWSNTRDEIYREIHEDFWNEELQSFVQSKHCTEVDASCLLMPLVRFISPTDPRWRSTLKAVGARLLDDSLVHRYTTGDGLEGSEGTFTMCSFWYVECLARAGDLKQARFLFEKMVGYSNHLGLFAEELGKSGQHLGNFPQAFTHLSLISAACYLDQALTKAEGHR